MITVRVGGTELVIVPKRLLSYIEKCDYIKSRRVKPWDLLSGIPSSIKANDYQSFVEVAMSTVYQNSSFVSVEEELSFDRSEEGFYYDLWRSIEAGRKKGQPGRRSKLLKAPSEFTAADGIHEARLLWESATADEKQEIVIALKATDERAAIKKSSGPEQSSDQRAPEPETQSP